MTVLGKGLSSLMGQTVDQTSGVVRIPLKNIQPNPDQPRKHFDESLLNQLKSSINVHGVLQPIIVRKDNSGDENYLIVAGERRYRASLSIGLYDIPAMVVDFNEREAREIALIENVQREDLNPIEEAQGYYELLHKYNYSMEEVCRVISKSKSYIINLMRLLNLPDSVKEKLIKKELTIGHARALINKENSEEIAATIVEKNLSVRDVERLVKVVDGNILNLHKALEISGDTTINLPVKNSFAAQNLHPHADKALIKKTELLINNSRDEVVDLPVNKDVEDIVNRLTQTLNCKVNVTINQNGQGSLQLIFENYAQLDVLLQKICT